MHTPKEEIILVKRLYTSWTQDRAVDLQRDLFLSLNNQAEPFRIPQIFQYFKTIQSRSSYSLLFVSILTQVGHLIEFTCQTLSPLNLMES